MAPAKAWLDLHGSYSFYLLIVVLEVSGIMILVVATIRIISQISTGFLPPSEFPQRQLTHLLAPIPVEDLM
jgi:hypothetical protein